MANYQAAARSNYFRVKDLTVFTEWCTTNELVVISNDSPEHGLLHGFYSDEVDTGAFITSRYSDELEDDIEVDLGAELAAHLVDGWVAVLMEAGHENLRYVCGFARAVNSKGEQKEVYLNQIYDLAAGLGEHCTDATY